MNILAISSILPITPVINDNDFIYHLYKNYKNKYQDDKIVIIKPVKYDFNIKTILKGQTRLQKLDGKLHWQINDFQVEIFPFYSAWTLRNLHALVSRTIFYVNRKRIKDLFNTYQFDIIHARFIFADGILAYLLKKKYNIPYVISTHNEMFYFQHYYSRRMSIRILNQASYVLPGSYTNLLSIRSYKIENLIQTTHGFDSSFIRVQRKEPNDKVHILTVCQLIKLKNIDKVIHALNQLKKCCDFKYTIIGTGPEKEYLMCLVNAYGLQDCVLFIDHIPHEQIAEEMYKHDIFIMPSYFETFGRVYFEVMAMGIPIICARNSGIYGLFKENEEGLAVDHTNIKEIANTLKTLIANREVRLRIGKNGQVLVKKYTWDNIVKDLRQKYLYTVSSKKIGYG
ncbi:MAG: glycosyltransferase family 4 protein [Bacteroidales bacterium]|nr:glycosyltransferase family 4 protein [Bacteroidales bacterium]